MKQIITCFVIAFLFTCMPSNERAQTRNVVPIRQAERCKDLSIEKRASEKFGIKLLCDCGWAAA